MSLGDEIDAAEQRKRELSERGAAQEQRRADDLVALRRLVQEFLDEAKKRDVRTVQVVQVTECGYGWWASRKARGGLGKLQNQEQLRGPGKYYRIDRELSMYGPFQWYFEDSLGSTGLFLDSEGQFYGYSLFSGGYHVVGDQPWSMEAIAHHGLDSLPGSLAQYLVTS